MAKKLLSILIFTAVIISSFPVRSDENFPGSSDHGKHLLNWIESNVSRKTGMPLSFYIDEKNNRDTLKTIGLPNSVSGIVERMIVEEGISIYDASLWQIVLSRQTSPERREKAELPVNVYWEGELGDLYNIRAGGFAKQSFVYDAKEYNRVSSDLSEKGRRGFIFRILNAHGNYLLNDPLDGKKYFEDYPNWSRLHWEDWKPIAGENAWVVIAALHLYHRKYYDEKNKRYEHDLQAKGLLLAKELARAAMIIQADNGGIRMAPIGTYFYSLEPSEGTSLEEFIRQNDLEGKKSEQVYNGLVEEVGSEEALLNSSQTTWYYNEQSTENNLSWYIALRGLYEITGDAQYYQAMRGIEGYLKSVWNAQGNYFYQGTHFREGQWIPNKKHFAADVQTWGVCKLGPAKIDAWFGKGASYKMWLATKKIVGASKGGKALGIGYSSENGRISVEWTVGSIYAMRELAHYYFQNEPDWAKSALADAGSMRAALEKYKTAIGPNAAAYPYSNERGWIPFGWFSHNPDVLSLVSTCWVYLYDTKFNPFYIGTKRDFIFDDIPDDRQVGARGKKQGFISKPI
ncbi:MAG: hypothetical protein KAR05_03715 [Candidatus Omnitrophica bacterium]|nr:hypothetical protein [Candidatus Omnitrophota bacterium]